MFDVVLPYQNAFIKGKAISDNIILSSEVVNTIARRKKVKELLGH